MSGVTEAGRLSFPGCRLIPGALCWLGRSRWPSFSFSRHHPPWRSARSRSSGSTRRSRSARTAPWTSPRPSPRSSPAPGTASTAPCRSSTTRRRGSTGRFGWSCSARRAPDGQPLRVESERDRHYIKYKIWVPGAEDATRTLVLRYRARNGLRFFEDHDELYWNVTGDEWDVPIGTASARIELPAGATGVRAIAFNGAYGSTAQDAEVAIEGTSVRVTHAEAARIPRRAHRRRGMGQGPRRRADRCGSRPRVPGEQLAARDPDRRAARHVRRVAERGARSAARCRWPCATSRPTR